MEKLVFGRDKPHVYKCGGIWFVYYPCGVRRDTVTFDDFSYVKNWFLFEEVRKIREQASQGRKIIALRSRRKWHTV